MNVTVLGSRVLIEPQAQDRTDSGIYVPNSHQTRIGRGTVLKIGEGVTSLKQGDLVLYSSPEATPVTLENKELVLIQVAGVLMIL